MFYLVYGCTTVLQVCKQPQEGSFHRKQFLAGAESTHLVVDILGVEAMLVVSYSLYILLVLGADDHNNEHRFLSKSNTQLLENTRLQEDRQVISQAHIIQVAVHPYADAQSSDWIVKYINLCRLVKW